MEKEYISVTKGKLINELIRLICLFVDDTKWKRLGLPLVHIFLPLMMQKPSSNSKAKENAKYLSARLKLWKEGKVDELIAEGRVIQSRLKTKLEKRKQNKEQAFCRLMMMGRVGPAMKFISNEDQTLGVHSLTEEIKHLLAQKHPQGRGADEEILLPDNTSDPLPVVFEEIDGDKVYRAALNLKGSGGPTRMETHAVFQRIWQCIPKSMPCDRRLGKEIVSRRFA